MKNVSLFFMLLILLSGCKIDENERKTSSENTNESTPAVISNPDSSNSSSFSEDTSLDKFSKNGHGYTVDVVAGATTGEYEGKAYSGSEKKERMHWSGRPEIGKIVGDYYYEELKFDEGYLAMLSVVQKDEQLISIEFDELGPANYYSVDWANQTKRLSGYAEFQAKNNRTDVTLVTVVNAMTFLEHQMLKKNTLNGEFYSVKGASNSVRRGYIPVANQLSKRLSKSSDESYYGITKDLGAGLFGRLVVIKNKNTNLIIDVKYDEYFADSKEEIADNNLKSYYRQSKYYSRTYSSKSGQNFKKYADELKLKILDEQQLQVEINDPLLSKNYTEFVADMNRLLKKDM